MEMEWKSWLRTHRPPDLHLTCHYKLFLVVLILIIPSIHAGGHRISRREAQLVNIIEEHAVTLDTKMFYYDPVYLQGRSFSEYLNPKKKSGKNLLFTKVNPDEGKEAIALSSAENQFAIPTPRGDKKRQFILLKKAPNGANEGTDTTPYFGSFVYVRDLLPTDSSTKTFEVAGVESVVEWDIWETRPKGFYAGWDICDFTILFSCETLSDLLIDVETAVETQDEKKKPPSRKKRAAASKKKKQEKLPDLTPIKMDPAYEPGEYNDLYLDLGILRLDDHHKDKPKGGDDDGGGDIKEKKRTKRAFPAFGKKGKDKKAMASLMGDDDIVGKATGKKGGKKKKKAPLLDVSISASFETDLGGMFGGGGGIAEKIPGMGGFAKGKNVFKEGLMGKGNPLSAMASGAMDIGGMAKGMGGITDLAKGTPLGGVADMAKGALDVEGSIGGLANMAGGAAGVTGMVGKMTGMDIDGEEGGGGGEGGGAGGLSGLLGKFGSSVDITGSLGEVVSGGGIGAIGDLASKGLGATGLGSITGAAEGVLNMGGVADMAKMGLGSTGLGSITGMASGITGLANIGGMADISGMANLGGIANLGGMASGLTGMANLGGITSMFSGGLDIEGSLGGILNMGGLGDALGNIEGIASLGGLSSMTSSFGALSNLGGVMDIQGGLSSLANMGLGGAGLGPMNVQGIAELGMKQLGLGGLTSIVGSLDIDIEANPFAMLQSKLNPIAVLSGINPLGMDMAGLHFAELSMSSPISTFARLTSEGFGVKGGIQALMGPASGNIDMLSGVFSSLSAGISVDMVGSLTNGGVGGIKDAFGSVVSGVMLGGAAKGLGPLEMSLEILGPGASFLDPVSRVVFSAEAIGNGIPGMGSMMGHQVTSQIAGMGDFLSAKGMLKTMGFAPVLDLSLGLTDSINFEGEFLISSFDIMGNGVLAGAAQALVDIGFPAEFAQLATLGAHISVQVELLKWGGSGLGLRLCHELQGASLNGGKHRSGGAGPKGDGWQEWKEWEQTGGTPPSAIAMYGVTYSGAGNGRDFFFPLGSLVRCKFKLLDGKATLPGYFQPGVVPGEYDIFYPDNPDNAAVFYHRDGVMIPDSYKQPNRDATFGVEGKLDDWNVYRASSPSKLAVYHEEDGKSKEGMWIAPETLSKAPLRPVRSKSGMPIYYGYLFHGIRDSPHVFVMEGDGLTGFFVPDDEEQPQYKETPRGVLFPSYPAGHAIFSLENVQDYETVKELRGAFLPDASQLVAAIGGRISRPENGSDFNFVMDKPAVDFVYVKGDPAMANIWTPFLSGEEWKYTPPPVEGSGNGSSEPNAKGQQQQAQPQPQAAPPPPAPPIDSYEQPYEPPPPPPGRNRQQQQPPPGRGRAPPPPPYYDEPYEPPPPPPSRGRGPPPPPQGRGRQPPPPPQYDDYEPPPPPPPYGRNRQQQQQPPPGRGRAPPPPPPHYDDYEAPPPPPPARGRGGVQAQGQVQGGGGRTMAQPPPPAPPPPPPIEEAPAAAPAKPIEFFGVRVVSQKTESFLPERYPIEGVFIPHDQQAKIPPFTGTLVAGKPNSPWAVNITQRDPKAPPLQKPTICLFQPIGFPKEDAFIGVLVLNPQNTFGQIQFTDKQKQTEHFWTPGQEVWTPHGFAESMVHVDAQISFGRKKRHAGMERQERQQQQAAMHGKVPGLSEEHVDPPQRPENYYYGSKNDGSPEMSEDLLASMPRKFHYGYWHMDEGSPGPLFVPEVGALVIFAPEQGKPTKGYYFPEKPGGVHSQILFEGAVADGASGTLFTADMNNQPSKEFVRATLRGGSLELAPQCEVIPGWKYATTKTAELPPQRKKEVRQDHARPSRRDLKYKLIGIGGGFTGVLVEGPEALDDANNPLFQEFLHYKAHRDGDVNPWGDVVVLDPIHRQLSPDGKTPGMGYIEPVMHSAKQITEAILSQFYLNNWEWPYAMEVDSVAGQGKPPSSLKLAEKGNIVNMLDFRMFLLRKYACKRAALSPTKTVVIMTPYGAERFFDMRKPAWPRKEWMDLLVETKQKLLMPGNEGVLGWFALMHNLNVDDLLPYMKRKPNQNPPEKDDPNKPEDMEEMMGNWKKQANSPIEHPPEWASQGSFQVWGDDHICDEIVLDDFEIVQAGSSDKKFTGVQLGYQLTAEQGSKMSWSKISGKLLKNVEKKRGEAPGEVLDDYGTTDLTGSVKKQMKGNVAKRRNTQTESGEQQGGGGQKAKSRRKREIAERVRRELRDRRRRKRNAGAPAPPGDDTDDGVCRNKPGWRTQYKHNFVENVTLSGEGIIYYGFGNCKWKGTPNLKILETRQPSNVIEYYLQVLRVECMQDARERVLQLFNERMLEFGADKMYFELPKSNAKIHEQKLLPDDIKKLSVAFELSAFSKTYHKLRTTGYPVTGYLREPNCIMTRSIGFMTEMALYYITKARRLVPTHSVRLTRNLIKTLRTALTKLHQDGLILQKRCKTDGCPLDVALVEGDMFRVVSIMEFIINGLRPYQRGHMDLKVSFYQFVGENKPAIRERIAEFKRQYKLHTER